MRKNSKEADYENIDFHALTEDMGYALIKALSGYEEAVKKALSAMNLCYCKVFSNCRCSI